MTVTKYLTPSLLHSEMLQMKKACLAYVLCIGWQDANDNLIFFLSKEDEVETWDLGWERQALGEAFINFIY